MAVAASDCPPVPPVLAKHLAAAGEAIVATLATPGRGIDDVVTAVARAGGWQHDYAMAIVARHLALGRHLAGSGRDHPPVPLLLLAASAAPLPAEAVFDSDLLDSIAAELLARLPVTAPLPA